MTKAKKRPRSKATGNNVSGQTSEPNTSYIFLNEAQREELRLHLGKKMDLEYADELIYWIDKFCCGKDLDFNSPGDEAMKCFYEEVSRYASKLHEILSDPKSGFKVKKGFLEQLNRVKRVADANADHWVFQIEVEKTLKVAGRPSKRWRDELIYLTYRLYPNGVASKTAGGHFEQTVEKVLGYLNSSINDLHKVVIASIRRGEIWHKAHFDVSSKRLRGVAKLDAPI